MDLDSWFGVASALATHPVAVAIQIQGCVIYLALAMGWAFATMIRGRELAKMKRAQRNGNSLAFLNVDVESFEHGAQAMLPRVTVVMPVKGFGEHTIRNWRSQLISLYGGPLEFIIVVESMKDPAYAAISKLIYELKDDVLAKVLVAGLSATCSQKIHNQLAGISAMHKESKYVLFLDDDVQLHPGTVGALVDKMTPEIFVLTGYPFDIPSGSLGSYCIYEYHMPCSIGFATGGRTFFLWGGCMMMHAEDFRQDRYNMVTGLQNGGYSDDMTLAAVAGAHHRVISSPPVAVFFHPLSQNLSFSRYWNYLRKQTFVLESYNSQVNWLMNRALFFSHCWLSWSFVAPYVLVIAQLAVAFRAMLCPSPDAAIAYRTGLVMAGIVAICSVIESLSLQRLSAVIISLCNELSPEKPPVSIKTYNWFMVFVAMVVDNFLYPVSAVYSHWSQFIDWAGVRYHLRHGKVYQIERPSLLAERQASVKKTKTKAFPHKKHLWCQ
ncbi:uncharacterized protein LOC9633534 [Selaginella moellendorffii]|uniref:uncharacterized protein LOC9633534 n=1 Tax=Selaginella moellendorffii TaxID=88036 RepID=UPI000D1CE2D5|nr:uncharacterized protein LOC9633534 [Selaginella moellendorffii]|eukprot:XP_024527369.1 uncharacterized protein LOC9633534 [Selaginella moellendorffii]